MSQSHKYRWSYQRWFQIKSWFLWLKFKTQLYIRKESERRDDLKSMAVVRIFERENSAVVRTSSFMNNLIAKDRANKEKHTPCTKSSPSFHFFIFRVPILFIIAWKGNAIWGRYGSTIIWNRRYPSRQFYPFFFHTK